MSECRHIYGSVWILNPNEGPAYLQHFIRPKDEPPEHFSSYRYWFNHCPCCGIKNPPPPVDPLDNEPLEVIV
jgi:hypothetical protein